MVAQVCNGQELFLAGNRRRIYSSPAYGLGYRGTNIFVSGSEWVNSNNACEYSKWRFMTRKLLYFKDFCAFWCNILWLFYDYSGNTFLTAWDQNNAIMFPKSSKTVTKLISSFSPLPSNLPRLKNGAGSGKTPTHGEGKTPTLGALPDVLSTG